MIAYVDSNHFVVVHGSEWFGTRIVIQDPLISKGKETIWMKDFLRRWKGEVLVFSEEFLSLINSQKEEERSKKWFGPHIYIDNPIQYIGNTVDGDTVVGSFAIFNTGSDTLKIR
jgi:ABC-type bacteriocin/lantibiotic exporter with double-glycine peptidase domain